ncbi:MAG: septation protein SepH [Micrococcales bacterium]
MDDLRISGTDGEHLILESQDGAKHRLSIDDALRSAIRGNTAAVRGQISLTPREIQTAIRSGASVDELVSRSGDPRDYVEKFAQPVIDELTHVLATALGVRISVAGDRYNEVSQTEFGEIIASRLIASGVSEYAWSTHRDENHSWQITVQYSLSGNHHVGVWSFDLKKLLLSPENDNAVTLSTQNQLSPAPKLVPVEEPAVETILDTAALPDTQRMETVIPIGRASDRVQIEKPATEEKVADSKDLLDALKRKREERAAETAATQTIEIEVAKISQTEPVIEPEPTPAPAPAPVRRSGRPSIPSFDEIVQGTKSDEE